MAYPHVVTRQLQVERGTGKVRRSEIGVLPLCNSRCHWRAVRWMCIVVITVRRWKAAGTDPQPACLHVTSSSPPHPRQFDLYSFVLDQLCVFCILYNPLVSYTVFAARQCRQRNYVFGLFIHLVRLFICSSRQISLPRYALNEFSNLDKTYREYSLSPTDDPVTFWRSKVKVTADHWGGKATTSTSIFYTVSQKNVPPLNRL